MKRVILTFVVVTATYVAAFRPDFAGRPAFYLVFGVPHLLLAALALQGFARDGTQKTRLMPHGGDITWGALAGFALLAASWGARSLLLATNPWRHRWLQALYDMLGDPDTLQHSVFLTGALAVIVVCEELVWRGMVLDELTERFGTRRGFVFATLLYTLATLPTVYLLRDAFAGPNPVLAMAAFGCGLVWTFLAGRFGRLWPSTVAHLVFTYFSAVQFRWPK